MINPLAPLASSALQPTKAVGVARAAPAKAATTVKDDAAKVATPAAQLAGAGAPIDQAKIDRIRAGIADGSYTVDPHAVAARMVALDLPEQA